MRFWFYEAIRGNYSSKVPISFLTYARIVEEFLTHNRAKENITFFFHPFRNLLEHGSSCVGLNAALCGLIANSLFRRVLNVTQARISAGLPMAAIPFLTAEVSYKGFVSLPLNTGKFYFTITKVCFGIYCLHSALIFKMAVHISMVYQTSARTHQLNVLLSNLPFPRCLK